MNPVWLMGAGSAASALAVTAVVGRRSGLEILLGMIGPLAVAIASWLLTERTYLRSPARLTSMMMAAFVAKMVFFGAYVAVMLRVAALRPIPFVVSFTSYFVALHLVEALYLRRLFAGDAH
jgi:hypothetical protein